jgi:hypothetical protein
MAQSHKKSSAHALCEKVKRPPFLQGALTTFSVVVKLMS